MKRYTPVIIIEIVIAVAVIGLAVYTLITQKNDGYKKTDIPAALSGAEDILENDEIVIEGSSDINTDAAMNADEQSERDESVYNEMADSADEPDGANGLIGYTEGLYDWNKTNSNQGGTQHVETIASPAIPSISFPYAIPGTSLIIQQVSPYSGYFIEDASDREVNNIAAIVLTNNGGDLEFVGIGISQGDRSLGFSGSQIPAGATVIIQEQTGAAYSAAEPYYSATATTHETKLEKSEDLVSIKDNGDGTFSVNNISDITLAEVKVYFKNYLPDEQVYVGGITYSITMDEIEPGTAVEITAGHYDAKYTVFVEIRVIQ